MQYVQQHLSSYLGSWKHPETASCMAWLLVECRPCERQSIDKTDQTTDRPQDGMTDKKCLALNRKCRKLLLVGMKSVAIFKQQSGLMLIRSSR